MDTCMDTNNNSKDLGDLESLVKMYKEGFLTEEEFKKAKAKILGDSDTKEKTENVTDELEGTEPESSDNSQENAATESSEAETPLEPAPSEKTASEKNINTETSDKENEETASSNSEVKKNYKKLYWGIGIVAVVALSVCAYLAYLYPTQNELLCFFNQGDKCYAAGLDYQEGTDTIKEDENKSLKYYEKGCELDNAISCGNLGFYYSKKNKNRNLEKASSYYKKACELGYGISCTSVGEFYSSKDELGEDLSMANIYFEKACQLKEPIGCSRLGYNYEFGIGVTQNYEQANEALNKACKVVPAISCGLLAKNYKNGLGIEKNLNKAVELYAKACKWLDSNSCIELGKIFKSGEAGFIDKDAANKIFTHACDDLKSGLGCYEMGLSFVIENYEKSIEWFSKGCEFNNAVSCNILSLAYLSGASVKKNYEKAVIYADKACQLGEGKDCLIVGESYFRGRGVAQDPKKSDEYLEKACSLNASFCTERALSSLKKIISSEDNDSNENIKLKNPYEFILLEKACKFSEGAACGILGSISNDKEKQLSYYQKSCEFNYALGCEREAALGDNGLRFDKNYKRSIELYTKACNLDEKIAINSCVKLAKVYIQGVFVKRDADKAISLFKNACANGSGEGCKYLADQYYYGIDVNEDKETAYDYLKKSCDYAYGIGCISLGDRLSENTTKPDSKYINKIRNKGINIFKNKCNNNDAESCYELGDNYLIESLANYKNISKRKGYIKKGIDLLLKACKLESGFSCYILGGYFENGFYVAQDKEIANNYYKYSCNLGIPPACEKINFKRP